MDEDLDSDGLFEQYQRLQRYVGWCEQDLRNVREASKVLAGTFDELIEDFYDAIMKESKVSWHIAGGQPQITRLKNSLRSWLHELFQGVYDAEYVERRWRIGRRHVEIGLQQVFADAALARLRYGLIVALEEQWQGKLAKVLAIARSINRLLDLELALIEDSYTTQRVFEERDTVRRRSEASFRKLVESARCVIVILAPDHSVLYINPFAEQVTGYRCEELLKNDSSPLIFYDDSLKQLEDAVRRTTGDDSTFVGFEGTLACRDGEQRSVLWNAQQLEDYEGTPAILAVGHDITELMQAQERLMQAERLAAIGQTVAGLAHESRNAFQRSQACLEMLGLEVEGNESATDLVQRIQLALDHLHHLYEEVCDYAAPLMLDRQPCDLAHAWRDAWSHLELSRVGKDVTFSERIEADTSACSVDWFQFGKVFRNIFENSLNAVEEKGSIAIHASESEHEGDPCLVISLRDDGPGITSETRSQIFDPFFTTKTKGTGLGMAIVKRIVTAHGGVIELGETAQGAEIVISIPKTT